MAGRYTVITPILVSVLLAAGIVGAVHHYQTERAILNDSVDRTLAAVVDLKVEQISAWRKERLADAELLRGNTIFSSLGPAQK
ncbi:MAG: hypothetical protein ACYC35_17020 [Pirellulales bacterium]